MKNAVTLLALGSSALALSLPALAQAQTSPSAFTSAVRYDAKGREAGTIAPDPDGGGALKYLATRTSFDSMGRPNKIESGELASWQAETVSPAIWTGFTVLRSEEISYDSRGRKAKTLVKGSDGAIVSVVQYSYDSHGRLQCTATRVNPSAWNSLPSSACSMGPAGAYGQDRIVRKTYDNRDRVTLVQEGFGSPVARNLASYTYYGNTEKPASLTDARGYRSEMQYNALGEQTRWIFPSKTQPGVVDATDYESYEYDANGNRTTTRKRDASIVRLEYDALNRVTRKDVPYRADLPATYRRDVYYGYDLLGNETYARFDSHTGEGITRDHDGFGRQKTDTIVMDGQARTLTSEYDRNGNRTKLTHPDGAYFSAEFDGLNRQSVARVNGNWLMAIAYDRNGQSKALDRGSTRVRTDRSFDPAQRTRTVVHTPANTLARVNFTYSYNPAAQLHSRTRDNDLYAYTATTNEHRGYTANGQNQYTAVGANSYVYDRNGNLTSDGGWTYKYDIENRLVEASGNGKAIKLRYDPLGRLYETIGSIDGTIRYLYDGDALVAEYTSGGSLKRRYLHGNSAGADDPLVWFEGSSVSPSTARHMIADHQGTVVGVIDGSGNPYAYNRFDEWGEPQDGWKGRFLYTGQAWLPELGMYHYKARIYSPRLGRFLQTDPIGYEGGNNLYAYAKNDPVNFVDFTGQAPNKAGAADYRAIRAMVRSGGLAALAGNRGNNQRYFYTKTYGWIDVRHFGTAARDVVNGTPGVVEEVLGFGNEVYQWASEWGDDYRSGFSPEDLPSNSAGIDFGQYVSDNPDTPVEQLFAQWATKNGAPASSSEEYQDAYRELPATDPSDRGGAGRGSSNPSSSPRGGPSNDNGSGSNQSNGNRGCNSGVVSDRRC